MQGQLVTLGVVPTWPSPNYGYIKAKVQDESLQEVEKFVEKPEIEIAKKFLNEGGYFWNSGVFIFRADVFQDELKLYENKVSSACQDSYRKAKHSGGFIHLDLKSFQEAPNISIDYALFERTERTFSSIRFKMVRFRWLDSPYDHEIKDINDNVIIGDELLMNLRTRTFTLLTNLQQCLV